MADDLGYADVVCYGRPDLRTPNIDRIAARGVRFLQAYANSAVCSATRTALITGRYQYRLPRRPGGAARRRRRTSACRREQPTLPSLLKKAGYGTTLIGKWHLGSLPSFGPLQERLRPLLRLPRRRPRLLHAHAAPIRTTTSGTTTCRSIRSATSPICSAAAPSTSINGYAQIATAVLPQPALQRAALAVGSARRRGGVGAACKTTDLLRLRRRHAEDLPADDRADGSADRPRARRRSTRTGSPTNTIVVFTSDNGGERFADTWPFTGRKTELLEGGLRIPAIVSWPARIAAGPHDRSGGDQHGLAADAACRRRRGAAIRRSPPDGINLLPRLTQSAAPPSRARCSGATRPTRSARCATATSST